MDLNAITLQTINAEWLLKNQVNLQVLRLDKIDGIISGNKWFKLKYYLQEAKALQKTTIATFGGAWSNHIVAAAYACKVAGLKSIGIIRGERPATLSDTLIRADEYGMHFYFVSRQEYRAKEQLKKRFEDDDLYWINEGGYGMNGAKGAAEILKLVELTNYTHVIAAVGTGTMMAGLLLSVLAGQEVIGISSLKGNFGLEAEIEGLLGSANREKHLTLFHNYHFGGYGKHPPELIEFINDVFEKHQLPLDIVYTGKTFYALKDLVQQGYFNIHSNILMIHSGGLQGNSSIPKQLLAF